MPITEICNTCNGDKDVWYLINMHSDEMELCVCRTCNGLGKVQYMTDEEVDEYYENYC